MKISRLPAAAIDRLLLLDRHADAMARAAALAEAEVNGARTILNSHDRIDPASVLRARNEFPATLKHAQESRRRADAAMRVASACKAFVDLLSDDAEVTLAAAPQVNGVDLAAAREKIVLIRAELNKISNLPQPLPRAHWQDYVDDLRRAGRPLIGLQGVGYPMAVGANRQNGSGFDDRQANPLLMEAWLRPDALVDGLVAEDAARCNSVLAPSERPEKLAALESQLVQLQSLEVHFVNAKIESGDVDVAHDPAVSPQIVLGVNIVERRTQLAS